MRFWEIGLIFVNFGLLYWAVIANKKGGQGLFIPLGIAIALVIVQIVGEGGRWEMVPAYLTPLLLMAYFFIIKRKEAGRSRIAVTVHAILLTVYLLVSVAPPAVLPVFSFEEPTGPYAVGTTVYHWIDDERRETYSDNTADRRELMAQIWYPAAKGGGEERSPYQRNASKMTNAISSKMMGLPVFVLSHLKRMPWWMPGSRTRRGGIRF